MSTPIDLELVDTSSLLAEIERRFQTVVVAGYTDYSPTRDSLYVARKGSLVCQIGLLDAVALEAKRDYLTQLKHIEQE